MKPIVKIPEKVLTAPAKSVTSFDKKTLSMVADMKHALMHAAKPKGVGLAAPQIGLPYRIFITRPAEKSGIRTFINPEIVKMSQKTTEGVPERENKLEGCLSIPNIWGHVKRAESLTLRYQDEHGNVHEEKFSGFLATIIQHETDHTNGVLFPMRVIEQHGNLFQITTGKDGKEVLEEIELK